MRLIYFFCAFSTAIFADSSFVTYGLSGGRFGDNLLSYLHAKWLSYEYNIPLLYRNCPLFSLLNLSEIELPFTDSDWNHLRGIDLFSPVQLSPDSSCVYHCGYFPAYRDEQISGNWGGFPVDWKDPEFRQMALVAIAPKEILTLTLPPSNAISIAIHVREGGGYDNAEQSRWGDPYKFPPMNFYPEALNQILPLFHGKRTYCYIFTDCQQPEIIMREIAQALPEGLEILFDYRKTENHPEKNILEDFFSLFYFDVLIRPRSNFSIIPSLLKDYAVLCYPAEITKDNNQVNLTKIGIEINKTEFDKINNNHRAHKI